MQRLQAVSTVKKLFICDIRMVRQEKRMAEVGFKHFPVSSGKEFR